jgi:hypothetical protein
MLELCLGIIAASLPSLKPLFKTWYDNTAGLSSGTRQKSCGGAKTPFSANNNNDNNKVGSKQRSSRRQRSHSRYDDVENEDICLDSYEKGFGGAAAMVTCESVTDGPLKQVGSGSTMGPMYSVKITRGRSGGGGGGGGEGDDETVSEEDHEEVGRGDSQERLHPPNENEICRTVRISRTSEPMS